MRDDGRPPIEGPPPDEKGNPVMWEDREVSVPTLTMSSLFEDRLGWADLPLRKRNPNHHNMQAKVEKIVFRARILSIQS